MNSVARNYMIHGHYEHIHRYIVPLPTKGQQEIHISFNNQGHIGTGPQLCHLWELNPHRGGQPVIRCQIY